MIHDVDESLRALVRRDVLNGANVEVSFEAPTRDWSSRRNAPTLNLYLYDIHEDLTRRSVQFVETRGADGKVNGRRMQPRQFKLSYMVTAWTQRAEDEHRLLAAILHCFLRFDALPADILKGEVTEEWGPLRVTVGLPLPADRSISDVWSALGGELKASLDLVVTAPFDPERQQVPGPLVLEHRLVTRQAVDLASLIDAGAAERAGDPAVLSSEMLGTRGDPDSGTLKRVGNPPPRRLANRTPPPRPAGKDGTDGTNGKGGTNGTDGKGGKSGKNGKNAK